MNAPVRHATPCARLFVYGTLLSGEPNHGLLAPATFVRDVQTEAAYELRDLGAFPALVRRGVGMVSGELYDVDAPTLATLDRLEGHPRFYRRTRVVLEDGVYAEAYVLGLARVRRYPVIDSGIWRARRKEKAL